MCDEASVHSKAVIAVGVRFACGRRDHQRRYCMGCALWSPVRVNNGIILLGNRFGATDHYEVWPKRVNGKPAAFGKLIYLNSTAGWPLRCLKLLRDERNPTRRLIFVQLSWSSFAVNSIFYATMLWMVFTVPGELRRRVRSRLGQCETCGYSLCGRSGSERCPECGICSGVHP